MAQLPLGTMAVAAGVDETSALVIVIAAAVAGLIVLTLSPRVTIPVVVIELLLGIIIGPQGFDLAQLDPTTSLLGDLGLGMLFFFAGYEIDFERIKGRPLELAGVGWAVSLALAYGIGGVLAAMGVILSFLYTGSAMATTAIGTLIPILTDAGEMRTRFGTYLLGAGAIGEFGPILLVTLILSTGHPLHEAVILVLFIALAVITGILAVRSAWMGWPLVEKTFETSSQLAVRLAVVLVFALVALAAQLGLDLLLGGFVAGMITRIALRGREVTVFDSKLNAVGYGLLIPFFFITSGMAFNLDALTSSVGALLKVPMFVGLFLVVRGVPALLLYRRELDLRDRFALAVYSATELPLVVAITTLAIQTGHMRTSTAAGLVGAAILSTLIFPLVAARIRRGGEPVGGPIEAPATA
ncbi:MAG TPA: cation:proton antiporter [Solirubrobacterales bacterium]|jgi:Kef-type K+ transport system membrane component KefB|nr:cation:proton antiporter [Solirubrobacterales bacterium]